MSKTKPVLAVAAVLAAGLLFGCPAEEKANDTTQATTAPSAAATQEAASTSTTTTTEATGAAGASGTATTTTTTTSTTAPASGAATTGKGATRTTQAANTAGIDAKAIFMQKCSGCHGANGGGGMGPSLQHVATKGDAFIHNRIMKGSATKGMPAFGDSGMLKPAEVDAMVAYVKTL